MELTMEDNLEDMLDQLLIFDSERAAKANLIMKTKVGCVNSLLKRYAEKRLMAQELQSSIINIKELYKQSCIDRMELREKHAALEEEIKKLQTENKKNEEKFIAAINQCEGIQSHSRQLELLIKENETTIEALKIENNLERSSSKDFEKNNATLQKENNLLIKNIGAIRDVVFGKKKATKDIKLFLNKYGKFNESQEENSSDETDAFEDCLSPLTEPVYDNILVSPAGKNNKTVKLQSINIIGENIINRDDNDSQSSSEIVSSDTGRGSSLAFSDSDKCSVLSPEYYVHDSPAEARSNKDVKMVVSVATSPLHTRESTCVATSPIIFEDSLDQMDIELPMPDITTETGKSSPSAPIIMVDRIVSPIFVTQYVDTSTNTDKNINSDVGTSPVNLDNRTTSCSYASDHNIQEQECLDINNSNNLIDENSNDGEIQMIFDAMRFNTKLITPIPTTPAKPRFEVARNIASQTLLNIPDLVKKEDLAPIFAQIAMLQQEMKNVITECQRTKSSISILESSINAGAQQKLKDSYLMKNNREIKLSGKRPEPEAALVRQNDDTFMATEGTKNLFDFNSKISKMKELFDDSSPPRPSKGLLLQPPVMPLSRSPWSPSHVIHSTSPVSHSADTPFTLLPSAISRSISTPPPPSVSPPPVSPIMSPSSKSLPFVSPSPVSPPPVSPPPVSPPPVSPLPVSLPPVSPPPVTSLIKSPSSKSSPIVLPPPLLSPPPVSPPPVLPPPVLPPPVSPSSVTPLPSPAARGDIMPNNNTEGNRSFKSKERLHFEDYLSNQDALSDEGMSDQDISLPVVVELSSDCHENDIGRLHKIVEEKQRQLEQEFQSEEISLETQKVTKSKRMTKLEKLRKNMAPKSKIKKPELQARKPGAKLRIQPKRLTANKERILSSDVIDPKAAYENARKVMAELKSKEKVSSKPNVANLMSKTPKKYVRKSFDNVSQLSSTHTVENEAEIHGLSESRNCESVSVLENLSPLLYQTTICQKDCVFESGNETVEKVNLKMITPKSDKTSISDIEADNVSSSGLRRSRSLNKCSDGNGDAKEYGSEVTHFNTNHLTSPSLRRYGKKRIAHKVETTCINNNNTLTESYVHENPVLSKEESNEEGESENRKRLKRPSLDQPDVVSKRILRNTSVNQIQIEEDNHEQAPDPTVEKAKDETGTHKNMISYDDLDMFENMAGNKEAEPEPPRTNTNQVPVTRARNSNNGILCVFLDKYSNYNVKKNLKISENLVNAICKQLEDSIGNIQKLPPKDTRQSMDKLVKDLQNRPPKHILAALIKYLKEPARKIESYNKIFTPPAPPMTKVEQILIYIVAQLNVSWPDFIEDIFVYIEYTLFMLNRTPEFDAIETLSHFYAVLCRYNKNRNRLRLFIIDAMYCLNFKAVPLIKQCLDVWMHILPLAHMGMAKGPLVTCLVYLLHFFKCEDKFNRVQDIRNVLHRKYFYQMSEWNETGMLEMFRNSIKELRDIPSEKKMLRMALIILAKRNGPRWCQANIIKNMLLPIIEEAGVPDRIKHFCVAMLGPLLKPFPIDMKVNCEIIMNQLFDMLKQTPSLQMEEAIFTSLIYMSRHNQYRVIKALLCWRPDNISKEFEDLLKNYVKERSVKSWRQVLAKIFVRE